MFHRELTLSGMFFFYPAISWCYFKNQFEHQSPCEALIVENSEPSHNAFINCCTHSHWSKSHTILGKLSVSWLAYWLLEYESRLTILVSFRFVLFCFVLWSHPVILSPHSLFCVQIIYDARDWTEVCYIKSKCFILCTIFPAPPPILHF